MYRITENMLALLPARLAQRNQALLFLHLNLPHYPAEFAQTQLHLPPTANDRAAYRQNLQLVDRVIGQIVQQLSSQPAGVETLLLLSSDHWHRIDSPRVARNIPFIAWHVGEHDAVPIVEPISTVHTGALVLDFLAGKVTTHAELAEWWRDKPVSPPWIPNNYKF
jgi:membrane-anchored protein YejM (alkaline phosphatase superfamily)